MQTLAYCLLCGEAGESAHHLFFHCTYSAEIMQGCHIPIPGDWLENEDFLSSTSGNNPRLLVGKLFISVAAYQIWTERNKRLHENRATTSKIILHIIKSAIREKIYGCASFNKMITRDPSIITLLY